jgi:putative glutamine amidotransferase
MAPQNLKKQIKNLSGILFTGGGDINPSCYGIPAAVELCHGIDPRRDALELELLRFAWEMKIPLLGICRGMQILNVFFKGTLIPDISTGTTIPLLHQLEQGDSEHEVTLVKGTNMHALTKTDLGVVNSAHHQALAHIGKGLTAVAHSRDGLVEAVEIAHHVTHPFCMAVQWHPERMDICNPLSGLIGKAFLAASGERNNA